MLETYTLTLESWAVHYSLIVSWLSPNAASPYAKSAVRYFSIYLFFILPYVFLYSYGIIWRIFLSVSFFNRKYIKYTICFSISFRSIIFFLFHTSLTIFTVLFFHIFFSFLLNPPYVNIYDYLLKKIKKNCK